MGFSKVATSNYTQTHAELYFWWFTANNYCCNIITATTSLGGLACFSLCFFSLSVSPPSLYLFSHVQRFLIFFYILSLSPFTPHFLSISLVTLPPASYYGSFKAPSSKTNFLQTGSSSHCARANLHTCIRAQAHAQNGFNPLDLSCSCQRFK